MNAYIIMSTYTGSTYISETRDAFVYGDERSACAFTEKLKDTFVKKVSKDKEKILTACREAGANRVRFMGKYIDLCDKNTQRKFYNGCPTADISRYAHTGRWAYLADLKSCTFILPVQVRNRPSVSCKYATVAKKEGEWRFAAFTNLEKYTKWKTLAGKGWSPLQVEFTTMRRIGEIHGFFINPGTVWFEITPEIMDAINEGRELKWRH